MFCVSESFVLYINSAQPRLQVSVDARPLHPTADKHQATQAHLPSQQVSAGWCYGDPTWCAQPRIYLLSDSQQSLQLRRSIPECNDLLQFKEDTGGPSVPVQEINLLA